MSEHKPEADETGRAADGKAGDKASSPSRRRALKAALASAPIIMSIKSRPAFAVPEGDAVNTQQTSSALSNNLSSRPGALPSARQ
jgi:hypothetical protein